VHDFLVKMGGAERVVKKLGEMFPDAPIYTLVYDEDKCGDDFPRARVRTSFLQKFPKFLRKRYQWLIKLMPYAIEALDLSGYDVVISSSSAYAHGVLTRSDALHVCYCHSPMRYAWDYAHKYIAEQKPLPGVRWLMKRAVAVVRFWDKVASDRPDIYVANSSHVAKRIEKYYRLPSVVIYPPVQVERFEIGASGDYFVLLAALTPYKKIDLAVSLFNKVGKKLIVIGGGPEKDYLRSIAGPNVQITGRLSENEVKQYLEGTEGRILIHALKDGVLQPGRLEIGGAASLDAPLKVNSSLYFSDPKYDKFAKRDAVGKIVSSPGEVISEQTNSWINKNFENLPQYQDLVKNLPTILQNQNLPEWEVGRIIHSLKGLNYILQTGETKYSTDRELKAGEFMSNPEDALTMVRDHKFTSANSNNLQIIYRAIKDLPEYKQVASGLEYFLDEKPFAG